MQCHEMLVRSQERPTGTLAVLGNLPGLLVVGLLLLGDALRRALERDTQLPRPEHSQKALHEPLPRLPSSLTPALSPRTRPASALSRHHPAHSQPAALLLGERPPTVRQGHRSGRQGGRACAGTHPLLSASPATAQARGFLLLHQPRARNRKGQAGPFWQCMVPMTSSLGTTEGRSLYSLAAIGRSLHEGALGLRTALDLGTR